MDGGYPSYSNEYIKILGEIAENFTQNVTRQLKEDFERKKKAKNPGIQLADVGFKEDGVIIKLKNTKLVTRLLFEVLHFNIDIINLIIDLKFCLHDLLVESDYKIVSKVFEMNIVQRGKIRFTLKNVHATGKVGFFIRQDSFMPVNYDIDYTLDEIITEISLSTPMGKPCEHNCYNVKQSSSTKVDKNLDSSLVNLFWVDLEKIFTNTLQRNLASVIVEYSMSELLLDEPENVKKYEIYETHVANVFFDECIKSFRNEYTNHSEYADTEPILVTIKHGTTIESAAIRFMNLETLNRISEVSSYANEMGQFYFAYLTIQDFHYIYETCKLNYLKKIRKGTMKSHMESNKLLVKIHAPKNAKRKISVKFVDLGQITLAPEFMGNDDHAFSWMKKKMEPYFTGYVRRTSHTVMQKLVHKYNM